MKILSLLLLMHLVSQAVFTQIPVVKAKEVNLHINCQTYCDIDFLKTRINSVNYIIDRFEANVYLMIISEATGSGEKVNLLFEGQKEFKGINDTISYFILDTETTDITRERMVSRIKLGLVPYFTHTPFASALEITLPERDSTIGSPESIATDKWKNWIFSIGTSGNYNKDDYQSSRSVRGSVSAGKTTEKIKISSNNSLAASTSRWVFEEEEIIVNRNRASTFNQVVFSIGNRFAAGGNVSAGYDQYNNHRFYFRVKPAVEYNVFPYKESVKKMLTINYSAGPAYYRYIDTSYYGIGEAEWLVEQYLSVNSKITQKWGEIELAGGWSTYLNSFTLEGKKIHGTDINNYWIFESVSFQILKGLSIYLGSSFGFTQGVLPNIPQKDFTQEDLITNSRVYPTSKSLYLFWGLNYRFGSKTSNIVNPRFEGGGGSFIFYD